jgi:hypothetical protein
MVRRIAATRYVTPLREGGSLPAIVEADDDGLYVLKFRAAGHGARALVAELAVGELARRLDLPVPELVLVDVDAGLGRAEPDSEIRELVTGSVGTNVALDYLPGAVTFDPVGDSLPDADLAARIVWLDSLVVNIDRAPQNPNLLTWHGAPWLIDHGAALYVHSNWRDPENTARQRFELVSQHVLLPRASSILDADTALAPRVTRELLEEVFALVPDDLLVEDVLGREPAEVRAAYVDWLLLRLAARDGWLDEAEASRLAAIDGRES